MECICADGTDIEPMIILAGALLKEKHFMNDLSDDIMLGVSDSGYINDLLSYEWLQHFNS
jgi:hypothetical protein